jgi:hypothetical protein
MTYLFDVVQNCSHTSAPVNISGSPLDVARLKLTCSECGTQARVNSAQEVGLDPTDPGFDSKADELTSGFSSLSYYVATVRDNKLELTPRMRKTINIEFAMYCNTCNKQVPVDLKVVEEEHRGHVFTFTPVADSPLSAKLLEAFRENIRNAFGKFVSIQE